MRGRSCLVGGLCLVAGLFLAPAAGATTATIGQVSPTVSSNTCSGCSGLQASTDPATPSYVVPPVPAGGDPWTMTAWSMRGGLFSGSARALIWRRTSTPGEFRLIASTTDVTVPPGMVTSFPVTIAVDPGDVLGVRSADDGNVPPNYDTLSSNDVYFTAQGDPVVGETTGAATSDFPHNVGTATLANVSATLTSPDRPRAKKKCKKHKHRSATSAKKKKCKKKKKR